MTSTRGYPLCHLWMIYNYHLIGLRIKWKKEYYTSDTKKKSKPMSEKIKCQKVIISWQFFFHYFSLLPFRIQISNPAGLKRIELCKTGIFRYYNNLFMLSYKRLRNNIIIITNVNSILPSLVYIIENVACLKIQWHLHVLMHAERKKRRRWFNSELWLSIFVNDLRKTSIVCAYNGSTCKFYFKNVLVHLLFSLFISLLINQQHVNHLNIELYRFKRESLSFKLNTI